MSLKTRPLLLAAAIAALVAAAGAQAAEKMVLASLGDVSGKVMINQGQGFVAARRGMEVRAGDRVITLEGAAARIVYKDGCVIALKERNLLPVDAKGCATRPLNPNAEAVKLAQAIGGGSRTDTPTPGQPPAGTPPPPVVEGGVSNIALIGVAVLGLAALGGGGGGGSPPISPR